MTKQLCTALMTEEGIECFNEAFYTIVDSPKEYFVCRQCYPKILELGWTCRAIDPRLENMR